MNKVSRLAPICALLLVLATGVRAQSSCSSDGVPRPVGLVERFMNADCEACWRDAGSIRPGPRELALDWIVPGSRGADAPLSAAAGSDAEARLQALGRPVPAQAAASHRKLRGPARQVRVARGLAFNGYVGASIELKRPGQGGPWRAWLVLVETLPAGTEGSPVPRNLVRNVLRPDWEDRKPLSKAGQERLFESRPMSIPQGAQAGRLRVVGWVEDARGQIRGIAQSLCVPVPPHG
jgi:hypothetical protein